MNQTYEHYYNITLLDDLHNYFPEILYGEPNSFRTVGELLEYIRSQTRDRFDLYSSARRRQLRGNQQNEEITVTLNTEDILPNVPLRNTVNQTSTRPVRTQTQLFTTFLPTSPTFDEGADINNVTTSLLNLINTVYPPNPATSRSFMEPVVVRPTQEQITNATSIIELSNSNEICAICQENMLNDGSQQIRRINHCRHTFHDNCISRHFRSNVRCPNCRHDIRGTTNT